MTTVVIICNDQCVAAAKEAIQPLLYGKVAIVPNIDAGLKAVFENRPRVVFIQKDLDGISAETFVSHVRSLFQVNAPFFVHLGHAPGEHAERDGFKGGIDLTLPEEELVRAFRAQLEDIPTIRWKSPFGTGNEEDDATLVDRLFTNLMIDAPADAQGEVPPPMVPEVPSGPAPEVCGEGRPRPRANVLHQPPPQTGLNTQGVPSRVFPHAPGPPPAAQGIQVGGEPEEHVPLVPQDSGASAGIPVVPAKKGMPSGFRRFLFFMSVAGLGVFLCGEGGCLSPAPGVPGQSDTPVQTAVSAAPHTAASAGMGATG